MVEGTAGNDAMVGGLFGGAVTDEHSSIEGILRSHLGESVDCSELAREIQPYTWNIQTNIHPEQIGDPRAMYKYLNGRNKALDDWQSTVTNLLRILDNSNVDGHGIGNELKAALKRNGATAVDCNAVIRSLIEVGNTERAPHFKGESKNPKTGKVYGMVKIAGLLPTNLKDTDKAKIITEILAHMGIRQSQSSIQAALSREKNGY